MKWEAHQDCRSYIQSGKIFNGGSSPDHSWGIYDEHQRVVVVDLLPESVRPREKSAAIAQLIAAAPELLAACKLMLHVMEGETEDEAFDGVRAVIAKAEGRTNGP